MRPSMMDASARMRKAPLTAAATAKTMREIAKSSSFIILLDNRWVNWNHSQPSLYVDGVDVLIQEERPLNKKLYSHKFKHAASRFQVATGLGFSGIVFASGGVPAGEMTDLEMVRETLLPKLGKNEKIAADRGYRGEDRVMTYIDGRGQRDDVIARHNENIKNMKARHETVNKRLKDFAILTQMFRGNMDRHHILFAAVAEITNIKLQRQPLFSLNVV
ncbi:hypothetical protein HDU76_001453 [Blyttiomyces sp. JEL0837]|nr:hypothetical protein HDU76_001453 [Blyttiomyces sp. JEL0837]